MNKSVGVLILLLSGCADGRILILPDLQDQKFACDMDPYKQGCERHSDYDRHYKLLEDKKG
ncbi:MULTISPECIES: hypothetical protein [unclassified Pseudomonas]|uniref:hypothetical protein n=1 Tax=unclassified Pseudomonas TaxID=196821 RepID=UPI000A1E34C6|nr:MULTISPECIES: hypothetical protein [unclassified Pseudomonas]